MCYTCKVAFLVIRPIAVFFYRSLALPSLLSITRFYILFQILSRTSLLALFNLFHGLFLDNVTFKITFKRVKCVCNIESIGALRACTVSMKSFEICSNFANKNIALLSNFRTFPGFSKCKALEDFLISFLEIVHLKGYLGGISQNSNF